MDTRAIALFFSLGVFPLLYVALCVWMKRSVSNPPRLAFFFIFGSVGGYILLCALLMPSPIGLIAVLPYMLVSYLALIGVFVSTLLARPRTRFHVAASITSGMLLVSPIILILAGL